MPNMPQHIKALLQTPIPLIKSPLPSKNKKIPAILKYIGSKYSLLDFLLPLIPNTKTYVEPFGGIGSVIANRNPSQIEVYNDLDGLLVNFFRVLQDKEKAKELLYLLSYTPYARQEFVKAIDIYKGKEPANDIRKAWALFILHNLAMTGSAKKYLTGGNFSRCKTQPLNVKKFSAHISNLSLYTNRFRNIQVDCRPAIEILKYWDSEETTFYCDPPYLPTTRYKGGKTNYDHEMTIEDHETLCKTLLTCQGAVVLSGYSNELYDSMFADWDKKEKDVQCSCAGRVKNSGLQGKGNANLPRTEVVWRNPKAVELCGQTTFF